MRHSRIPTYATYGVLTGGALLSFLLPRELTPMTAWSSPSGPATQVLDGVVRDFRSTHADFDIVPAAGVGHTAGNVALALGPRRRPVFTGEVGTDTAASDPELVSHWSFDEGSGTVVGDGASSSPGTLVNGPTWVAGRFGSGLRFDGVNDHVTIPSTPELMIAGDVTISGWFKLDDTFDSSSTTSQIILEKYIDDEHNTAVVLAGADYNRAEVARGALCFKVEHGPTTLYFRYKWTNRTSWTAGEWYHFAFVLDTDDSAQNRVYINGVDDTSPVDAGTIGPGLDWNYVSDVHIGGVNADYYQLTTPRYFKGVLDEIMIHSREFTEVDVVQGEPGFKVATQWRDLDAHPIAPHLYGTSEEDGLYIPPGATCGTSVILDNSGDVDSWDSGLGAYGGANMGSDAPFTLNATSAGAFEISNSAQLRGHAKVGPGGDPASVITDPSQVTGTTGVLPEVVPMPVFTAPPESLVGSSSGPLTLSASSLTISTHDHYDQIELLNGSTLTIMGDVVLRVDGPFTAGNGADLVIAPGGSLHLFVEGPVDVAGGQINMTSDDPFACQVYATGSSDLTIENASAVTMRVSAPNSKLTLENSAQMFGVFIGRELVVSNNADFHVDVAVPTAGSWGLPSGCGNLDDTAGSQGADSTGDVTSSETFEEWYSDVLGVNMSTVHTITLVDIGGGVYEYADTAFHPIDERLWGNEGEDHNYFFSYAIQARFVYEACAGQFFEFEGADDMWLFVGDDLAIDLGGVRPGTEQRIDLDRLDLVDGETYGVKLFHAQRQDQDASFRLRTNVTLDQTDSSPSTVSAAFD